jgi:hypothetical protein
LNKITDPERHLKSNRKDPIHIAQDDIIGTEANLDLVFANRTGARKSLIYHLTSLSGDSFTMSGECFQFSSVCLILYFFRVLCGRPQIFTFSSKMKTSHSLVSQHIFKQASAEATSSSLRNFAPIALDSSVRIIVDEWTSKRSANDNIKRLVLHNFRSVAHGNC